MADASGTRAFLQILTRGPRPRPFLPTGRCAGSTPIAVALRGSARGVWGSKSRKAASDGGCGGASLLLVNGQSRAGSPKAQGAGGLGRAQVRL
eukprot:gene10715-biopygen22835